MKFDYVVIGAGISGLTIAERIASELHGDVLLIEKRPHIGGNCYDRYDDEGILIHPYGPHIFHTPHKAVWDYLSKFTQWRLYQHRVLSYVDGNLLPFPICTDTVNALFGLNLSHEEARAFLDTIREPDRKILTSEDVVISQAGREIFEKFFLHYTKKQWDMYPKELDPSVIARVPIRTNSDQRYFTDAYQGIPKHGYTRLFERMIQNPRIKLLLNIDYKEIIGELRYKKLICTAPIDAFFDYRWGSLAIAAAISPLKRMPLKNIKARRSSTTPTTTTSPASPNTRN